MQSKNVEALGCLAVLYMRHTNFAEDKSMTPEAAAKKAAKDGLVLLQVSFCTLLLMLLVSLLSYDVVHASPVQ
jgi:hypothetical protein